MFARWQLRSGFSQPSYCDKGVVKILGFVEATIELGYRLSGTKRCTCAVVVDEHGTFHTIELSELRYVGENDPDRLADDDPTHPLT